MRVVEGSLLPNGSENVASAEVLEMVDDVDDWVINVHVSVVATV